MKREQYQPTLTPWSIDILTRATQYLVQHCPAYLVGGSVRNLLLHEPCNDWDIVVAGDASKIGRQLANTLGGYYAHLHEKANRVVVKHEQLELSIDLAPLVDGDLNADLHMRDFTLNAIAAPLSALPAYLTMGAELPLIDPLRGVVDLQQRCLRAVTPEIFQHDPLRLLRAIRFSQRYQLTLEDQTKQLLVTNAPLLLQAAPERIHEELYAILQPAGATQQLRFLDELGLLTVLIPEFIPARGMLQPVLHHWDVLEHSIEAVAALERLTEVLQRAPTEVQQSPLGGADLLEIQRLLNEAQQQGIFQWTTLSAPATKMAALLHDIGKPTTHAVDEEGRITFYHHPQAGIPFAQHIMQRINASTSERRLVQQVVAHHMRSGQLSNDQVSARAIRRYFVDLGPTGIIVALISLSDHLAMRGPQPLTVHWQRHLATVRVLLDRYIRARESIIPPRLLQAEELMHRLNITPGPLVGQLLECIAEAQSEGRIHSKEDALWLAEEVFNQTKQTH